MTLPDRIEALARAIRAVRGIGLDSAADTADAVLEQSRSRAGFVGDSYVLALAGGTGVGKSSVLNALAGVRVSEARAVRPTTDQPIAWVADSHRGELAPLLEWLGVIEVRGHADGGLERVAILDLPDMDSVRTEHRRRVDELLPRLDAMAWVVDPEKYDDERLYSYLRELGRHASRLRVILNKTDRLGADAVRDVVTDLQRRLDEAGLGSVPVHAVSAETGDGIEDLRSAIESEADAKAIVTAKLEADVEDATRRLAAAAGVVSRDDDSVLLPAQRRSAAIREAQAGALALVDPHGVATQARAAVLSRARRTGGGLLGRTVGLLSRLSGREQRRANVVAFLGAWRQRGTLSRASNPIRAALLEASSRLPSESRPAILETLGAERADVALERSIDAAVSEVALDAEPPGSFLWPIIGFLQLIAAAVFLFAIGWYVTLFLLGFTPVLAPETVAVPVLGPVPMPLALLAGSLVASAALGLVLSWHAGWLAGRFARRVARRVRDNVAGSVESDAFAGLDAVEAARRELREALPAAGS